MSATYPPFQALAPKRSPSTSCTAISSKSSVSVSPVPIAKYGDRLPLYRQSQIHARLGLELHRATLADWVGKASFHLRPLVDCLAADLKRSGKLGVDETPVPVLDPGRGKTKTGYMWTMVRDERPWSGADPPGVVYAYAPGGGGKHAEKLLAGFSGTAQIDGYSGYNPLRRADRPEGPLTLAECWAHARRALKDVFDSNIANRWDGLLAFLYDGRVQIDSNFVENRIRPLKLNAKNALFAGHDEGAAAWARIAAMIETCKMNGVEPRAWLKSTLEKIAAGHPQSKIHQLLPWNFDPEAEAETG